jgi:Fe2+ or Zn2+ uptake regulation protein
MSMPERQGPEAGSGGSEGSEGWSDDALRRRGVRLTASRRAILEAVRQMPGSFSVSQLEAAVHRATPTVGRASVFRTLALLTQLGLVQRLHGAAGRERYIACGEPRHHHHVTCVVCGRTEEFQLDPVADLETAIDRRVGALGFQPRAHIVEVLGVCPDCRA